LWFGEGKLGTNFGVVAWDEATVERVECMEDADAECECRADRLAFERFVIPRFDTELAAEIIEGS
jgi:hypothetical protein